MLLTVMVIFFWDCPFPPLVEIRENPEFHGLMRLDKAHWPRSYSGMAGYLFFLALMVPLPGLLMLLRVLVTWLRLRSVGIFLGLLLIEILLMILIMM